VASADERLSKPVSRNALLAAVRRRLPERSATT
jgi:hypothetical protein